MVRFTEAEFHAYVSRGHRAQAAIDKCHSNPTAAADEAELHEAIRKECLARGWIAFHGSMAHRSHRTIGEPDFVILADSGRVILVEAKSKHGKLSSKQLALRAWAEKLGHVVYIVRSLAEFEAVVGTA